MKFSVVTPTRNSLDKLKNCVGSIRSQRACEIQHLVQDALSSDGTAEWLAQQEDLDWRSEADRGMYDAINRGWGRAQGEILSWLNSDEQYLPGTLSAVQRVFDLYPAIDFVYGNALVVNRAGNLIAARREIRLSRFYIANGFLNAFSCTLFYRRRLWDQNVLRLDERYRYAADMDLILRLLAANRQYYKIDAYLSVFMLDGTNLSCHPRMLQETEEIQRNYGGFGSHLMRRVATTGRYLERLFTGSYRRVNVQYQFAENEIPTYRDVTGIGISGSYRTR